MMTSGIHTHIHPYTNTYTYEPGLINENYERKTMWGPFRKMLVYNQLLLLYKYPPVQPFSGY